MGRIHRAISPNHSFRATAAIALASLLVVGLAACGGSDNNSSDSSTAAASNAGMSGSTVSTQSIGGVGTVLVDSQGNALYSNDMDSGSKVACTDECAAIWVPLAAPSGGQPTSGDASIQAKLGAVDRPDGTSQVTYGGKPLYTFTQDSAGNATGNGVMDSFAGTDFTWTIASAGGSASSAGATTTTGGSSGGYRSGY